MMTMGGVILLAIAAEAQDTTQWQRDQYRRDRMQQDTTGNFQYRQDTTSIDYYEEQQLDQDTAIQDREYQYRQPEEIDDDVNLDSTYQQLNEELEQDVPTSNEDAMQQDTTNEEQMMGVEAPERDASQQQAGRTEEIKVIEGKEGPNHEVVYEYEGKLFYVDRQTHQMVEVKKSDLKDSKHEIEIKEGTASGEERGKRRSRG